MRAASVLRAFEQVLAAQFIALVHEHMEGGELQRRIEKATADAQAFGGLDASELTAAVVSSVLVSYATDLVHLTRRRGDTVAESAHSDAGRAAGIEDVIAAATEAAAEEG